MTATVFELILNLFIHLFVGVGMAFVFILWKTQNLSLWGRSRKYHVMKSELYKCLVTIGCAHSAIETGQIVDKDILGSLKQRKAQIKLVLEFLK